MNSVVAPLMLGLVPLIRATKDYRRKTNRSGDETEHHPALRDGGPAGSGKTLNLAGTRFESCRTRIPSTHDKNIISRFGY